MKRAALLLLLTGCRSAAYTIASHQDTPDAWRAYLADNGLGAEADAARQRLEALEWGAVEEADTPRAYRRFLDAFPGSDHVDAARQRLALLRHQVGVNSRDPEDLDALQIAAGAAAAAFSTATATGDPSPLRTYLARQPEGPRAAEARDLEDDLSFALAARGEGSALQDYLGRHPQARHRAEAEQLVIGREVRALLWEERFVDADTALHELAAGPLRERLARELCAREVRQHRASPQALADLRGSRPHGEGSDGLSLSLADEGAVAVLARGLDADELVVSEQAAWSLADTGSPAALDPLLRALGSERPLSLRWAALLALEQLVAGWPAEVRELELGRRRAHLVARAASAPLWLEQAALEEGLGSLEAGQTLSRARHDMPADPLLLAAALRSGELAGAERTALEQQLRAALAAVQPIDRCGRAALAALAQRPEPRPAGCPAVGLPAVVRAGEERRLRALSALSTLGPNPVLTAELSRLAERDGSSRVRVAARAALGGTDDLATAACAPAAALPAAALIESQRP